VKEACVSRFGDRHHADDGCKIGKVGVNQYRLVVDGAARPHVFVETLTPDRVATVLPLFDGEPAPYCFYIFTFNLLNGYHPGSDLRVRILYEGDPELVTLNVGKTPMEVSPPASNEKLFVQVHSRDFRVPRFNDRNGRVEVETLITRTPPMPLETNIEIAVIRAIGPIHSR